MDSEDREVMAELDDILSEIEKANPQEAKRAKKGIDILQDER